MDEDEKLAMLKSDLQRKTSTDDDYLRALMEQARAAIIREGIAAPEKGAGIEVDMAVVSYAAYLFRKRGSDAPMPRYLRYSLNNLLISQKGRADDDI